MLIYLHEGTYHVHNQIKYIKFIRPTFLCKQKDIESPRALNVFLF